VTGYAGDLEIFRYGGGKAGGVEILRVGGGQRSGGGTCAFHTRV